ncbi:hypothetical protein ACR96N_22095 [Klebsiella pneumoniae]|uniref:Conjugal transfer transcriptional regulator TraJ n=10 Tax=Enterobacteriaceae TaxID=543 RepID=A0AA44SK92_CITFR|nr:MULTISPECIES: hypothetical protein [Enterobacteriaceae]HDT5883969.1 hypothetical protein [Klebsiella pneumoniae subsp. pneumoniae]AKN19669.1 conjugal transfer transcriptional regulator TraJ [Enterobacter cloacae]AQZ21195.1 conjugal transfer transcriptional regulator TraJ [Enterobacter cloacae]AQZ21295.1 conjugal transfer transcriptional regulator TraJ [Enterobacter cloacae]ASI56859.1 hypothetical protein CA210_00750 [Raoultella ornithinolytica]
MCAKDRSQNSVCSQTEFIQYLDDVFSISSSLSLIRDSQGELVHLSPLFETLLLKGSELKVWFSFIPLDVRLELFNAELNSLSGEGPYFSKNVKSMNQVLNIFIECIYVKGRKFTRWVFFPESNGFFHLHHEYDKASKIIDDIFYLRRKVDLQFWKVFNLYAFGFTNSKISSSTNLTEDQVKKTIKKIKAECFVSSSDCLALLTLYTLNYNRLAINVINILSNKC